MNKVVVVIAGAIVVVVAATAAGVVLLNHLHYSSSQPNVPYNTFYLLNNTYLPNSTTPIGSYYIFVISYKEYSQIIGNATNTTISAATLGYFTGFQITKTIIKGDHVFLIGFTSPPLNVSVGAKYPIIFVDWYSYNPQNPYKIWLTYEGKRFSIACFFRDGQVSAGLIDRALPTLTLIGPRLAPGERPGLRLI